MALVMAGQPFQTPAPKVVGVELTGTLSEWVTPKDIILEAAEARRRGGGLGRIFEFFGPGVASIDVTGRTICNMIAELGATTGVFSSTRDRRRDCSSGLKTSASVGEGAGYEARQIELDALEPLIAQPRRPATWSR